MRELVRAQLAAVCSLGDAGPQLPGFLLRHGHDHHRPARIRTHQRWLSGLRFAEGARHIVLDDCIATVDARERRDRLTVQIEKRLADWTLTPVIEAMPRLRGMACDLDAKGLPSPLGEGPGLPDGMKIATDGMMFCSALGGVGCPW